MQSVLLLGRQPVLGRAELESLYGAGQLRTVGDGAMLCSLPSGEIDFARLGGSIKLGAVLEIIDSTDWRQLQTAVIAAGVRLGQEILEGKIQLGLSVYDLRVSTRQLTAGGLELKKALRAMGRSVRLIQNQELALNSAQVLHNHLTGERGIELVLVRHESKTILARTVAEQDITAYTVRDRGRPKRDAFVGMLPPKLAQVIINLSGAEPFGALWDPFCGTGVLLQEALLMGIDVYGSDIEPRMIEYATANLAWLDQHYGLKSDHAMDMWRSLQVADATTVKFASKHTVPIRHIASETYLGQPFSAVPAAEKLAKVRQTCNLIIEKFLKNISGQITSGARLCLAVPAWQVKPGQFVRLPLLDRLSDLGYNRIDFKHARASELLYYRPDQIVARELLVITRK